MFLSFVNVSIHFVVSGTGITQDFARVVMDLSRRCLGLDIEGCYLGLGLRRQCLVNITDFTS